MTAEEKKAKRRERNKEKRIEAARMLLKYAERPERYKTERAFKAA